MGHTDAQMVYKVYGKWMSEKSDIEQVSGSTRRFHFAPSLPQSMVVAQ
jgi:integrase